MLIPKKTKIISIRIIKFFSLIFCISKKFFLYFCFMEKILNITHRVVHSQTDYFGNLSVYQLGNMLLDIAGLHAENLGIAMDRLISKGFTWVIVGLKINIFCPIKVNQIIEIQTGINSITNLASERFFRVFVDNQLVASAQSMWMIIDYKKRNSVFLGEIINNLDDIVVSDMAIESYRRLKFNSLEEQKVFTKKITYTQLDINKHLYSMEYIKMVLDLFDLQRFENQGIKSINMNYISEVLPGEEISFYIAKDQDKESLIEIKNKDSKTVFRSQIIWN